MTKRCDACGRSVDVLYDNAYCIECARRTVHGHIAAAEAALDAVQVVVRSALHGNASPADVATAVAAAITEHGDSGLTPIAPMAALVAREHSLYRDLLDPSTDDAGPRED